MPCVAAAHLMLYFWIHRHAAIPFRTKKISVIGQIKTVSMKSGMAKLKAGAQPLDHGQLSFLFSRNILLFR